MMKSVRHAVACALAAFVLAPLAAMAQPAGGAYGPAGTGIIPVTAGLTGSYAKGLASGVMAAGLAANAPVYSFRYGGTGFAVIKRITIASADGATAFVAGVANFSVYDARAFTASDSGGTAGTLTGNNSKLKTTQATTAVADIRISSTAALTPGTRTLDTDPVNAVIAGVQATAGVGLTPPGTVLFDPESADYPLVIANNEGFVIQATVPITGTWSFSVFVEWDEFQVY